MASMHVSCVELRLYATAQAQGDQLLKIEAHLVGCPECVAALVQEAQSLGSVSGVTLDRLEQKRRSGLPVGLQLLCPFSPERIEAGIIDVAEGEVKFLVHRRSI